MSESVFPRYMSVAAHAVLVEFGEEIDDRIHEQVLALDAAVRSVPFAGFLEAVPAYASLLVSFNPLVTDHRSVKAELVKLEGHAAVGAAVPANRDVLVCYDDDLGPDLAAVSAATGLSSEEVINAHLAGDYKAYMYGFAPGYAYLAGVPEAIQRPRKVAAVRGVPSGSVLIAGPQCLVSTVTMPTGWWIIGRSPTAILDRHSDSRPFLFDVGDRVTFRRISRAEFEAGDTP